MPRFGELFLSARCRSGSSTEDLVGDAGGYASSTGFRMARALEREPEGLSGRGMRMWPSPFTPGSECALPIGGGANAAADLDRMWLPDSGEVVLGRYGREAALQVGEMGEEGEGSVARRMVGGFRGASRSEVKAGGL